MTLFAVEFVQKVFCYFLHWLSSGVFAIDRILLDGLLRDGLEDCCVDAWLALRLSLTGFIIPAMFLVSPLFTGDGDPDTVLCY
jgi:hypothetical protein